MIGVKSGPKGSQNRVKPANVARDSHHPAHAKLNVRAHMGNLDHIPARPSLLPTATVQHTAAAVCVTSAYLNLP